MTSAITNPMHVEVIKAVMGADVMLGHDPDCARWIRRFRDAAPPATGAASATGEAPRGPPVKAAIAGARLKIRRFAWRLEIHSSYSRLPASAAISR